MALDLQNRPNDAGGDELNPEQGHYDDTFNRLTSAEHMAKDGTSADPSEPKSEEAGGASNSGTPDDGAGKGRRFGRKVKGALWGTKLRRNSTVGGSIIGLLVGSAGIGSLWFAGPLEVVHIAQFLTKSHFQAQEDAGDGRMGKLYRYVRSGGDAGETRLGFLGSHYKTKMIADLKAIGIEPKYTSASSVFSSFEIDTTKDNSFKGMSEGEVKARLEAGGIDTKNVTFKDGKATIGTKQFFGRGKGVAANKFMVKELGYSKVSGALRVRILNKYGMVTWHPLRKLDSKLNDKLLDSYKSWKEDREARYKTGVGDTTVVGNTTQQDEDGKTTSASSADENAAAAQTVSDPNKSSSVLKSLGESKGAGIAGGLAAIQGLVCGLKTVNDNIDVIHYEQVALPLMRMGWDALTIGNQIMAGQDVDAQTVKFVAKSFTSTDPDTGKKTNWNQAESIQARMGNPNSGIAAPGAYSGIGEGHPAWLSWTDNGAIGGICSTAGQITGGAISIGLGIISGGVVSTVTGLVSGAVVGPKVIDAASHLLAGKAVNVAATGAEYGSAIDYGAKLNSNTVAMQFGGAPLSTSEVAQLDSSVNSADGKDFASKSIAYRIFNPEDSRTLAAKMIDNSDAIQPQNIASTIGSMFTNIGSVFASPASLLTAKAQADSDYNYGFKQFGFSQSELDNGLVQDPYANAEAAAKVLDGPSGQTYIDRAEQCFGMKIDRDSDNRWQVYADPGAGDGKGVNVYAAGYPNAQCRDKDSNDWLRVRFFIFDTGVMEGWACYQGDSVSCQHDGVEDAADSGAGSNLRIASYNVWGASHSAGDSYKGRMDKTISTIQTNQIDVVGFQEFQTRQRAYAVPRLSNAYDIYPQNSDNSGHIVENSIIWDKHKFKLIDSGVQPNLKYFDGNKLRAPWIKLEDINSGQQFYVLNTHDPASTGNYPHQERYRYENALEHVKFVQDLQTKDNLPIFFTGDFNSGYTEHSGNGAAYQGKVENLTYCILTDKGKGIMADSYDLYKSRPVTCPNPTKANEVTYGGIDHVYISKNIETKVSSFKYLDGGPQNNGSDHPTLIIDAAIPVSGGADGKGGGTTGSATPGSGFVGNDGFPGGSCVAYVEYILRRHSSKYHGGVLGNGKDVANSLGRKYGYTVNHTPAVHAVVSFSTAFADPVYGHTAIVSAIHKDGSITVEEANWTHPNRYGTHVVKAGEASLLTYAHTEDGWH